MKALLVVLILDVVAMVLVLSHRCNAAPSAGPVEPGPVRATNASWPAP